jgi:hypothetical protein
VSGRAKSIEFAIAFLTRRADAAVKQIVPKTEGDVVLWFAQGHFKTPRERDQSGHGLGVVAISRLRDGPARCHRRGLVGAAVSADGLRRRQKAALTERCAAGAPIASTA